MVKKEAVFIIGILIIIFSLSFVFSVKINSDILLDDADNDGYNVSVDCNDYNETIWVNASVYSDSDIDGIGAGELIILCIGENIPAGYSLTSGDCDDNNETIWQNLSGYRDNDFDSYGAGNLTYLCSGESLAPGYSNINGDCSDNHENIHPGAFDILNDGIDQNCDGFDAVDLDLDSFLRFNLNLSEKDCDDTNPFVHPGAEEKCNGIDNDCDGAIDEGFNIGEICFVGEGECTREGVMVCTNNGLGTRCKAVAGMPVKEICDGKDNNCDGEIDEEDVCLLPEEGFLINYPKDGIYNTNNIPVNLSAVFQTGKKADKINYIDYSEVKPREMILCRNCNDYGKFVKKSIKLKEGLHNLSFSAISNKTVFNESRAFFIDSKKPKLYLPRIRTKGFTNGTFFISYDEGNLKNVTVHYENKSITNENCSSGKKQECILSADLSEYSGKDITYSLRITDIAGNIEQTKNMTAEVDITPPVITEISYPVILYYIYFRLNITEKNFKDVSYFDNSDENPKWRILCSVLKNGICEKKQRFKPGEHTLTIRVMDKAGNAVFGEI